MMKNHCFLTLHFRIPNQLFIQLARSAALIAHGAPLFSILLNIDSHADQPRQWVGYLLRNGGGEGRSGAGADPCPAVRP